MKPYARVHQIECSTCFIFTLNFKLGGNHKNADVRVSRIQIIVHFCLFILIHARALKIKMLVDTDGETLPETFFFYFANGAVVVQLSK